MPHAVSEPSSPPSVDSEFVREGCRTFQARRNGSIRVGTLWPMSEEENPYYDLTFSISVLPPGMTHDDQIHHPKFGPPSNTGEYGFAIAGRVTELTERDAICAWYLKAWDELRDPYFEDFG